MRVEIVARYDLIIILNPKIGDKFMFENVEYAGCWDVSKEKVLEVVGKPRTLAAYSQEKEEKFLHGWILVRISYELIRPFW